MKILYLFKYVADYDFDHYLHADVAIAMNKHPDIKVKGYGLHLEDGYPDFAIPYNKDLTLKDIKKEFDFDIIVLCTKARMFDTYTPPWFGKGELRGKCWLPSDFKECKVPKIVLEEDYHYENSDDWYKEVGIDLILQRHYSNYIRGRERNNLKHLWFPFSVDTSIFKPNKEIERINKICNASSMSTTFYIHRNAVCNILDKENLLESMGNKMKNTNYPLCLQSYVSHLCGSGKENITAGKLFEIMASGSLLFTNESERYGIQYLFPKDCYCTYKEDYSDVKEKAMEILNNKEYVKETTAKAIKHILENHTHETRTKQFLDIMKEEFKV